MTWGKSDTHYTLVAVLIRTTTAKVPALMGRINEIDQRVLATLTGGEKIKALLAEKGLTLKDFARAHGEWVENVSACIRGERQLPEVRDALATELGLTREQVDELIGQKAA